MAEVPEEVLLKMKQSGLAVKDTNWRKELSASVVAPKVTKLLTCANKHPYSKTLIYMINELYLFTL